MSVVTHLPAHAASLRKVTRIISELRNTEQHFAAWRPDTHPWYAFGTRAIGVGLDWSAHAARRDGLRGLKHWLDARCAHSAMPLAELQEAHA